MHKPVVGKFFKWSPPLEDHRLAPPMSNQFAMMNNFSNLAPCLNMMPNHHSNGNAHYVSNHIQVPLQPVDVMSDNINMMDNSGQPQDDQHVMRPNVVNVRSVGSHGTLYCKASINPYRYPDHVRREYFRFIFDPGASATILSKRIYDALPDEARPDLYPVDCTVKSAQGAPITLHSECHCEIELERGIRYTHKILVCDVVEDGFIGNDFIWGCGRAADIDVQFGRKDGKKNTWTINRKFAVPLYPYHNLDVAVDIVNVNRITVEPGQEVLVPARTKYAMPPSDLIVKPVTPISGMSEVTDVQVANTVVKNHNGNCIVRLANISTEKKVLQPGDVIAECETASKYSISEEIDDKTEKVESESDENKDEKKKMKRKIRRKIKNLRVRNIEVSPDHNLQTLPKHLHELYLKSAKDLNVHQKARLAKILTEKAHHFSKDDDDYGFTDVVTHHIDNGDAAPICQHLRHQPLAMQDEEDKLMDGMREKNLVEPSNSPWASPVVLVKKIDAHWGQ